MIKVWLFCHLRCLIITANWEYIFTILSQRATNFSYWRRYVFVLRHSCQLATLEWMIKLWAFTNNLYVYKPISVMPIFGATFPAWLMADTKCRPYLRHHEVLAWRVPKQWHYGDWYNVTFPEQIYADAQWRSQKWQTKFRPISWQVLQI